MKFFWRVVKGLVCGFYDFKIYHNVASTTIYHILCVYFYLSDMLLIKLGDKVKLHTSFDVCIYVKYYNS